MKRLYFPLIAIALASPTLCRAYNTWGGADYTDEYLGVTWDKTWTRAGGLQAATTDKAADWMADLPDNMFVAHVSIPGAHDFATGEDNWATSTGPGASTTQAVKMREQMDRGIRGIDLRPGLHNGQLWCNHGTDRVNVTLNNALGDMITFLAAHPKEFFIVHLFRGNVFRSGEGGASLYIGGTNDPADQQKYNELMQEAFQTNKVTVNGQEKSVGDFVVTFRPNLTVEEARGKMVLFLRDRIDFVHLDKQARITNWTEEFNNSRNPGKITNELNPELSTNLQMQDISSGGDDVRNTKIVYARNLIDFAQTQMTPNEQMEKYNYYKADWVMNFTSIENSNSSLPTDNTNGYKGGASVMNDNIREYIEANLGRGPLGVFFSDYVLRTQTKKHSANSYYTVNGDQLVYKIIENNFSGGENAPVIRYAIDTNKTWNEVTDNPYKGQKFFLRNVGASDASTFNQYLGGGANYGAHGVASYAGHEIELVSAGAAGTYYLTSCFGKIKFDQKSDTYIGQVYMDGDDSNKIALTMTEGIYEGRTVYYFTAQGPENKTYAMQAYQYGSNNPYFDRPEFWVDPALFDKNEPYQMWELVSAEDRYTELSKKANPQRGMDATYLVPSYSFGNGEAGRGWTYNKTNREYTIFGKTYTTEYTYGGQAGVENGGMYRSYNDAASGNGQYTRWSLVSSITGLPNGKYTMEFQAFSSKNTVYAHIQTTALTSDQTSHTSDTSSSATLTVNRRDEDGTNDVDAAGQWFLQDGTDGNPNGYNSVDLNVTDGVINVVFKKSQENASKGAFYLDNIRLTYYGDNAQPETIKLNFPNEWNTAILPFNAEVPSDVHAYVATGFHDYDAISKKGDVYNVHIIDYDGTPSNQFQANVPYLVNNPNAPKPPLQAEAEDFDNMYKAPRRAATPAEEAAAAKIYEFTGYPTNYKNLYNDPNNVLTGTIEGASAAPGHYHLEQTDFVQLFRLNDSDATTAVAANRAFFNKNTGATRSGIYFEEQNVLTGVEDVAAEEQGITDETPVDVYTTGGVMLRHGVAKGEALNDLPRGLYILTAGFQALKVAK